MPINTIRRRGKIVGYRWGTMGELYKNKSKAVKQARAAYASGYKKRARPQQHIRKIRTKKGIQRRLINKGIKKTVRKNYGILGFGKKKGIDYVSQDQFGQRIAEQDYEKKEGYGNRINVTGKKASAAILAFDALGPTLGLGIPASIYFNRKVDNVVIPTTDEHDNPIPKYRIDKMWRGSYIQTKK